jgi:hypothetical protein
MKRDAFFWDITPYSLAELLPEYMELHPRIKYSSKFELSTLEVTSVVLTSEVLVLLII